MIDTTMKAARPPAAGETILDARGCLRPAARLLAGLRPSLVLLADGAGGLLAANHLGRKPDLAAAKTVAGNLLARIARNRRCTFAVLTDEGYRLAFGVRLPAATNRAVLGGLVRLASTTDEQIEGLRGALVATGTAVWSAIDANRRLADLEGQLGQSLGFQTIGELMAAIAHEINTPAQYIRDNTRFLEKAFGRVQTLLQACLQLPEAVRREGAASYAVADVIAAVQQSNLSALLEEVPNAIDQSLEGIDHVSRMLRSMSVIAQPGGPAHEPVDLNRIVEAALTIGRSWWKHVARIETDLDRRLPAVTCAPDNMLQVLLILIVNAVQAIEEKQSREAGHKGTIAIRTRQADGSVEINIEDNGAGIPEAIGGRVFERFFTTKKARSGTGQGLAIARSIIVDRHGGTIHFVTRPGQGTTFFVRIPVLPERATRESPTDEQPEAHSLRR